MKYYAIHKGRESGIYNTWDECKELVNGFKGAKYKKFNNLNDARYYIDNGFEKDNDISTNDDVINVYTDGSCINNGFENARAGIGVFFKDNDSRNVSTKVNGKQTNNTAELKAIKMVYKILKNDIKNNKNINIFTDSKYAIKCCTDYGEKNYNNKWKDEIPNLNLVKEIYELYKNCSNVKFIHVKAHTKNSDIHSYGNSQADYLANCGALS
jgi:ribonuclease HI